MAIQQEIINLINYQIKAIVKCGFVPQYLEPIDYEDYLKGIDYRDYRIWAECRDRGLAVISIQENFTRSWFSFPCGIDGLEPFFDYHETEKAISWAKEVIDRAIDESEFAKSVLEESYV